MKKLFAGEFNFTYFCLALLAAWISLNEFTQAVADTDRVADFARIVSINKANETKAGYFFKGNASEAFAVKGSQIYSLLALIPQESQKLIVKFKVPLLTKHIGEPETLRDKARSGNDLEYKTTMKDGVAKQLPYVEAVYRYLKTKLWNPDWLKNKSHSLNFAPVPSGGLSIKYKYQF
ncbi:MAG: hypothetical protein V3S16_16950 [Candidatus Desulfatibia sp.]|uniref:hypothetical protein n=1 Tax=Candidatus Desulfatibia sp. TaxID=3101189 RepID=UPI002F2E5AC1